MNEQAKKDETVNPQGNMERKVETVDYRSSPGQWQEQRNVQVIHQHHSTTKSNTSDGILAGAATAVASTIQSAKDAMAKK